MAINFGTSKTFHWLVQILVFAFGASLLSVYESHNYIAAVMLIVAVVAMFFGQLSWNKSALIFSLLVAIYCLPILFLYLNDMANIKFLEKPLGALLMIPPLALFLKHPPEKKYFETGIAVGLILVFFVALPQIVSGNYRVFLGSNPIPFAMTVTGMVMLCLPMLNKRNVPKTIFGGIAILLGLFLIVVSGTRAAYVAAPIGLFIYIALLPGKKKRYLFSGVALTAVALIIAVNVNPTLQKRADSTISAISEIRNGCMDSSIGTRLKLWNDGFNNGLKKPWLGTGYNDRQDLEVIKSDGEQKTYDNAHNEYVDAFSARGILGLTSTLLLLIGPIVLIWKKRSRDPGLAHAALAFYVSIYVNACFNLYLWRSAPWKLFIIATVVLLAIFYSRADTKLNKNPETGTSA
ncbi:MAG: O-antigen ligase family protein [bacterium]|nr:O-antigen ligase family protein [bacterium]MCP4799626.1 O-antigen ligase family protein [bacterium]